MNNIFLATVKNTFEKDLLYELNRHLNKNKKIYFLDNYNSNSAYAINNIKIRSFDSNYLKIHKEYNNIYNKKIYKKDYNLLKNLIFRQNLNPNENITETILEKKINILKNYWLNLIYSKKIDVIIFTAVPHFFHDYLLFLISKTINLKVIIIEKSIFPGKVFLIKNFYTNDFYKNKNLVKNYGQLPSKSYIYENKIKLKKLIQIEEIKNFFIILVRVLLLKKIKTEGVFYNSNFRNEVNSINFLKIKFQDVYKLFYLKLYYKRISKNIDLVKLKNKYVYFSLHSQPEKSTLPLGGYKYHNQIEAIKELRKLLPKDIVIIVKEHVTQLSFFHKFNLYRSKFFYKSIVNLDNVRLADINQDQLSLIKNSIMTATITGSCINQSFINKKFCIVFGHTPLLNLPNSIKPSKSEINQILKKKKQFKLDYSKYSKNLFDGVADNFAIKELEKSEYSSKIRSLSKSLTQIILDK